MQVTNSAIRYTTSCDRNESPMDTVGSAQAMGAKSPAGDGEQRSPVEAVALKGQHECEQVDRERRHPQEGTDGDVLRDLIGGGDQQAWSRRRKAPARTAPSRRLGAPRIQYRPVRILRGGRTERNRQATNPHSAANTRYDTDQMEPCVRSRSNGSKTNG